MQKKYIALWGIKGFYQYLIYEVKDGESTWYEAIPKITGLATRISETEEELKEILKKDVQIFQNIQQKVR